MIRPATLGADNCVAEKKGEKNGVKKKGPENIIV